jgi:hypothetical protein
VTASAVTDDGNLLALGMADGSVVLYNTRLAAVARTLERLGVDGEDPGAPTPAGPGRYC